MEKSENFIFCNKSANQCGNDAACRRHSTGRFYYCSCAQTGMPMNKDTRCGLNKVNSNPSNAKLQIHVPTTQGYSNNDTRFNSKFTFAIQHPAPKNITTVTKSSNVPFDYWIVILPILIVTLGVGVFLIAYCFMCHGCGFKKKKLDQNKASAVQLGKAIMVEERYTSNPQYTSSNSAPVDILIDSLSVPTLTKHSIIDLEKIGEGYFGEVYRGQLHSIDDEEKEHVETVAVKMLKETANIVALEDFLREVEIMSSFQHPNILTLIGVCPQGGSAPPWMVFEYMPLGDLADVLRNSNNRFCTNTQASPTLSAEDLLSIACQIAAGMEYLASQRFVHRDLACRNCLVGSALTVKISDFGMSRDVYTCDYYRIGGSRMLPVRWMSPESLLYGKFTLESDVWSYGVLLWEIYTFGKQPYFGHTNEQVLKLILDGILLDIPANCPSEVADIIRQCWKTEPKERVQFLDICNRLCDLKDHFGENNVPNIPRPPPMPVTVNYPLPFDDDEFDDNVDENNYLRPTLPPSDSEHSLLPSNLFLEPSPSSSAYIEAIP